MFDQVITLGNSQIQHGKKNNRIYLMHLEKQDVPGILDELDALASSYSYSKIFAKVSKQFLEDFIKYGYVTEAIVPAFYHGREDCIFISKYLDDRRGIPINKVLNQKVLELSFSKRNNKSTQSRAENHSLPSNYVFRKACLADAPEMAKLYSKVFDSYPFPISNPAYIEETMQDHVIYFGIWSGGQLVAASSCEMCKEDKNVEMTDFAILPEYRRYHLSHFLLGEMEEEMKLKGIKTAYTIARAISFGMNCTFAKNAYDYAGTLIQNTQIGGNIEDMNVWFKSL